MPRYKPRRCAACGKPGAWVHPVLNGPYYHFDCRPGSGRGEEGNTMTVVDDSADYARAAEMRVAPPEEQGK